MNFKWYIGAFIGLISVFVVQQQEAVVHNQEMVLHFNSERITVEDEQYSINLLTEQLEEAGAQDITAVVLDNGSYKISYHSKLNVASLKQQLNIADFQTFLANQQSTSSLPFEDESSIYQLDVYDLEQGNTGFADSDQALFFEIKQDFNRGSQVNHPFLPKTIISSPDGLLLQTAQGTNHHLGLAIADRSYAIPAVRAGPLS